MPEYLAPGVFVEEVSFRQKTIEGVSTSTAAFVGPTRFGPTHGDPELLVSFGDFERVYGGPDPLAYPGNETLTNYVAHAVRSFFDEGGRRLYVSRVFSPVQGSDGRAGWTPPTSPPTDFTFRARYPGRAGNVALAVSLKVGQSSVAGEPVDPADPTGTQYTVLRGASAYDVVATRDLGSPPAAPVLYWLDPTFDEGLGVDSFSLVADDGTRQLLNTFIADPSATQMEVRVLTVSVVVGATGRFGSEQAWENLAFDPRHRRSLARVFAAEPSSRANALEVPIVAETTIANGAGVAQVFVDLLDNGMDDLDPTVSDAARSVRLALAGGDDGDRPGAADYAGADGAADGLKSGLRAIEDKEDVAIVAAPGHSFGYGGSYGSDAATIVRHLISHCERMRYRIAVLDSGDGQSLAEVRAMRGSIDSKHAALYYPWVRVLDPVTESEIHLPPSGFLAGIYARNDVENGVHKAPANEVVRGAIGLEQQLSTAQQEVLNPEGVNCLRFFEGRGYRVWGARTATSDPEWKYVNLRRYFAFLERSIEKGTQFAVFEANGDQLWANVRSTVEDFLFNEWKSNHLLGTKPAEAFFVRCDRSTMTQNDLDNGRLVCLVGVAPLRPAEFVIFRIGQKTAGARS